jgi:hypothetical protein
VADMAKVEKRYRATTSVTEWNRLDLELEALHEYLDRVQQERDSICRMLGYRSGGTEEMGMLVM